jgi:hypothetical protein
VATAVLAVALDSMVQQVQGKARLTKVTQVGQGTRELTFHKMESLAVEAEPVRLVVPTELALVATAWLRALLELQHSTLAVAADLGQLKLPLYRADKAVAVLAELEIYATHR